MHPELPTNSVWAHTNPSSNALSHAAEDRCPTQAPLGGVGESASSSTDAPCYPLVEGECQGEDEQGQNPTVRPAKVRRTSWQKVQVPEHISTSTDDITDKLQCARCGAMSTMQYRVAFVRKHAVCQGLITNDDQGKVPGSCRIHARRKRVYANLSLARTDSRQLDYEWFVDHGKLPINLRQHADFGPIASVLCYSSALNAGRTPFIRKHMKCLAAICSKRQEEEGTIEIDTGEINRAECALQLPFISCACTPLQTCCSLALAACSVLVGASRCMTFVQRAHSCLLESCAPSGCCACAYCLALPVFQKS
eukprot:3686186-Amphidinium_carterae.3